MNGLHAVCSQDFPPHIGHSGSDNIGVDGTNPPPALSVEQDRSILEFQSDNDIKATGIFDAAANTALTNAAGA